MDGPAHRASTCEQMALGLGMFALVAYAPLWSALHAQTNFLKDRSESQHLFTAKQHAGQRRTEVINTYSQPRK